MRSFTSLAISFTLTAFLVGGCGDDTASSSSSTNNGDGGSTTTNSGGSNPSSGGAGMGGTDEEQCPAPSPAHEDITAAVDSITATYIDENGDPAEGVNTTVCGTNVCSSSVDSQANGTVVVPAGGTEFDSPRFNASHNALAYAKLSAKIPAFPTHEFGTVRVLSFVPFSQGVAIAAGQESSQGGVTLTVPADAVIEYDIISFMEDQRGLRGVLFDVTSVDAAEFPSLDPSLNLEVLIGVSPLATHICPGATLSFDNINDWAADADVEIFINGAKIFKHYAPYGEWAKIGDAKVSGDGNTVTTVEGPGIEVLGTFGARLTP